MPTLRHVHLRGLTPYSRASHLQEILVANLLRHKAAISKPSSTPHSCVPTDPPPPPPLPTILTFTPHPVYTTGRRERSPSARQLQLLQQPLQTRDGGLQTASFTRALRGGQITFHGPGQLVVYPVISLSHPYSFAAAGARRTSLSPRCYVHLLETCTIRALARYHVTGLRTENPGVWVDGDTKIAALGVHLRRHVTSHGVGLNVETDLQWFKRIVACGLEGKRVTSMGVEMEKGLEVGCPSVEEVAGVWVRLFAEECGLGEGDVVKAEEGEILVEGGEGCRENT